MKSRISSRSLRLLFVLLSSTVGGTLFGQNLLIDFSSTTQDGGPAPQAGYQSYNAGHEITADFITRSYSAFGATIDITPDWPNTTDNRAQQMIDRGGGNDANWDNANTDLNLVTDWLGIDTRTGNGGNGNWDGATEGTPTFMTLTVANLPAGTYGWTSYHHDTENVHTNFQIELSTDGGNSFVNLGQDFYMSDSSPGGSPDSGNDGGGGVQVGPDAESLTSTVNFSIEATGVDEVVIRFAPLSGALGNAVHNQLWGINGFELSPLSDADEDDLPDSFEQLIIEANPDDAIETIEDVLPGEDFDNDGSSNAEELTRGTSPVEADSDEDGLLDGAEDGGGTWINTDQTGSNPLNSDSDGDGLLDGSENPDLPHDSDNPATQPGTNPNEADSDGDGVTDGSEIFTDGTNPTDADDFYDPFASIDGALLVDFNSTTQDGPANNQDGFQPYDAGHEVPADFVTRSYTAFNTTVTLTPGWPNTTDNRVQQMIDRSAGNDANWANTNDDVNLVTDWIGVDSRTGQGGNGNWDGTPAGTPTYLTLTLGDLPRGTYQWTSFHHDTENVHGFFQIEISTDGGASFENLGQEFYMSDSTSGGNPNSDDSVNGFTGIEDGANGAGTLTSTTNLEFTAGGDDVVLRFAPLSNIAVHRQLFAVNGFILRRTGGNRLRITDFSRDPNTDELSVSWESKPGKLYNLRSTLDPSSTKPEDWELLEPHEDIAATPPLNTLVISRPADGERYFVVEEFNAPPLTVFTENFETGGAGWIATSEGAGTTTEWELGTPDPDLFGGPPAARSGSQCYGTDLDAYYVEDTLIRLQSPPIDLSGIVGGNISYFQWRDIEETFDSATVRLLDASNSSEIAILAGSLDGLSTSWEEVSHPIPAEAEGMTVILEFVLQSDDIGNQAGLYIDDISIQGPAL